MAAPIVYEGAMAAKEPPENGLFKNMKFWVSHRVPQRLTWVQSIQNNGGKVTPLEKNADYLISDHARKDGPPGSYSYKLIDDSIKAGSLQNLEDYLCSSATRQSKTSESRPSSSTASQRSTRTKFTTEDDSILTRWVIKNERNGKAMFGNDIYKSLEAKYPHHTYQSWRDRWVKKLQHLTRPEVSDEELSPPPPKKTHDSPRRSSLAPPGTPQTPKAGRASTQSPTSRRARVEFTEDDDNILIEHIRECIRLNKPIQGIKIFRDLANDFSQHSDQSWRARWVKQLAPKLEDKISQWQSGITSEETSEVEQEPSAKRGIDQGHEPSETSIRPEAPHAGQSPSANKTSPRASETDTPRVLRTTDDISTPAVTSVAKYNRARSQDDDQQHQQTAEAQGSPQLQTRELTEASQVLSQPNFNDVSLMDQFYKDYQRWLPDSQKLVPFHTVKGRTFELWQLWKAIAAQKMDPSERDWHQIAETLGYNWIQYETVHDELRECYEAYLAAYEDYLIERTNEPNTSDDSEVPLASSPPVSTSLKRSFNTHRLSSDHAYPEPSPKRRRIDRDTEIPSTPDHANEASGIYLRADIDKSPSVRRSTQPVIDDEVEENEARDTLHELPKLACGGKKALEPETQDFRFDPETQNILFEPQNDTGTESQCNITPSQQLRQESDAISAEDEAASPTPKAKGQSASLGTPTPRRRTRNPFRQDSDDETTEPQAGQDNNVSTGASTLMETKRRSLPKSFIQNKSTAPGSSTLISSREQCQSPRPEQHQPIRYPKPVEETAEDVIDRFCSLGYPRDIVLRALRATTWRLGDAGQVMEILKRGEELPQRTHGVWTQRDDDALKLVTSDEHPNDDKVQRKRARSLKRLKEKHGPELMELRRKYLWEAV